MKDKIKEVLNWIYRNIIWIILIGVGLFYIQPTFSLLHKLALIVLMEGIAIGLSGVALFCYTKINWTKKILYGGDNELSKMEQLGASIVVGAVFVGVHLLVGLTYYILSLEVL